MVLLLLPWCGSGLGQVLGLCLGLLSVFGSGLGYRVGSVSGSSVESVFGSVVCLGVGAVGWCRGVRLRFSYVAPCLCWGGGVGT